MRQRCVVGVRARLAAKNPLAVIAAVLDVRVPLPQRQTPPRRGPSLGVSATEDLVAVPQHGTVVVDSDTGGTVGELRHRNSTLIDTAHWIDDQTMLVARAPQFLAYTIADATPLGDYWELDVAPLR
jgi:hypothetical protein